MTEEALLSVPDAVKEGKQDAPYRVLFVCTGNTCRSPMAAAVLNSLAREKGVEQRISATSAGLYAAEGAPMTSTAVAALQKAGILPQKATDHTAHRARNITAEMVDMADVVVGLTAAHAMELAMRFPLAASKISTLPMDIPDPYGGSQEAYDACLAALRYCIPLAFFTEYET